MFAKYCRPAAKPCFLQDVSTFFAFFSTPPIDQKAVLKGPGIAIRVPVIPDGAPALGNGKIKDIFDGLKHGGCLFWRKGRRLPHRGNASLKQSLVSVNIANSGYDFLIHQANLDGTSAL